MEAALCRNLRQLPEALALLDRALALDRWGERSSLLVSKARTLEELGRHEETIALLRQAPAPRGPGRSGLTANADNSGSCQAI